MSHLLLEYKSTTYAEVIKDITSKKEGATKLCTLCWKIYSQDKLEFHNERNPDHANNLLESTSYASERDFIHLAKKFNKIFKKGNKILVINPTNYETLRRKNKTVEKSETDAEKKARIK
jgi:hypothetical protein